MLFNAAHIFPTADTYEKVLLQLLNSFHYIARGVTFKLREPLGVSDSGIQANISRNGPYTAADGQTYITFVTHFRVANDVDSTAYAGTWEAAEELTTATAAASFINAAS